MFRRETHSKGKHYSQILKQKKNCSASRRISLFVGNYQQQGSLHFAKRKANQLQESFCPVNHENAISHHANRGNRWCFTPNEPLRLREGITVTLLSWSLWHQTFWILLWSKNTCIFQGIFEWSVQSSLLLNLSGIRTCHVVNTDSVKCLQSSYVNRSEVVWKNIFRFLLTPIGYFITCKHP